MSGGVPCRCTGDLKTKKTNWKIRDYKCNYSAFSGYHRTTSDYSSIKCIKCDGIWRTKAKYVEELEFTK